MSEIVENDYNLNIPRYVDTTEEEPEIDFDEVWQEWKDVCQEESVCRENFNVMMRELGLKEF